MSNRNSNIISKGFRNYFVSVILLILVEQVCSTVDMLLVGNYVSPEAFAALDLVMPIESLVRGLGLLFIGGAGVIAARHIGNQEFEESNKVLSVALVSSSVFAIALTVVSFIFFDEIVAALCTDLALVPFLEDYLKLYLLGLLPITLYNALCTVLNVDGKPMVITICASVAAALDIVLDIVFMKYLGWGTAGQAMATICSYVLPTLGFIIFFTFSKKTGFRFIFFRKKFKAVLKSNIVGGVPFCMPLIVTCLIQLLINNITLNTLGLSGLYVWSVGFQLLSIGIMFLNSIGGTVLVTMGSLFAGSHDTQGLKELLKKCLTATTYCILPLIAVVMFFPDAILSLFGESNVLSIENAGRDLVTIQLLLIPYAFIFLKIYLEMSLGRDKFATLSSLLFFAFTIGSMVICSKVAPSNLFLSLPLSATAFVILESLYSEVVRRRKSDKYSPLFLIPEMETDGILSLSVPYSIKGRDEALKEVAAFLESRNLNPSVAMAVNLSCEELMFNIQQYNEGKSDDYFYDLFIFDNTREVKVSVKDAGSPFNPIREFEKSAAEAYLEGEDMDLSLQILNNMCKDLNYNYMYGQNVISMTFGTKDN